MDISVEFTDRIVKQIIVGIKGDTGNILSPGQQPLQSLEPHYSILLTARLTELTIYCQS